MSDDEAHHARDVLRLREGDAVELFDLQGRSGEAMLNVVTRKLVEATVAHVTDPPPWPRVTVASAVPKGDRADWLAEKLAEVGTLCWRVMVCDRSVVTPTPGGNKLDRWQRRSIEASKQSRRPGVMDVASAVTFAEAIRLSDVIALDRDAPPLASLTLPASPVLLIGPEGGWSDAERDAMRQRRTQMASLGPTVLRIETAALLAAAMCVARLTDPQS